MFFADIRCSHTRETCRQRAPALADEAIQTGEAFLESHKGNSKFSIAACWSERNTQKGPQILGRRLLKPTPLKIVFH